MDILSAGLTEKLENSEVKLTRQRRLIAEKIEIFKIPFSAEDLHLKGLKRSKIDLATIYRTLHLFNEMGWISKTDLGDGYTRYVTKPSASRHLHTLLCRSCHKIEHLNECFLEKQQNELLKKGFTALSHKVEFVGLCPECQVKTERSL